MSTPASPRLRAVSIAPRAKAWLAVTEQAYVLHAFERAINLVNQEGDVLTIADAALGNGPFTLLLEEGNFPTDIEITAKLLVFENGLWLGDWLIDAEEAQLWQPAPDWAAVRAQPDLTWAADALSELLREHAIAESLAHLVVDPLAPTPLPARIQQAAEQHIPLLFSAIAQRDAARAAAAAKGLAGLGPGLTPAGDDLLLGAMFGCWTRLSEGAATELSSAMAAAAIPRTHQLSAAWLAAGAAGEAPQLWHALLAALTEKDAVAWGDVAMRILPTGHSSGADALAGFLGVVLAK
ncbi:MAG: DUF2877 domain-containing protein [Anaerolineales bacterium]|nr:DUF2877 domain-containing protein [Anaerolineales bacterium]